MRSQPDICGRRQSQQTLFRLIGDFQILDESLQIILVDALAAGQHFKLFIGSLYPIAPHHGLYGFRQHCGGLAAAASTPTRTTLNT